MEPPLTGGQARGKYHWLWLAYTMCELGVPHVDFLLSGDGWATQPQGETVCSSCLAPKGYSAGERFCLLLANKPVINH